MKKSLVMLVLMFATAGLVQAAPQQPAAGQAGSAAPAQQKKEIKNPAEYNAYMGAIQQTDPTAKTAALEAFLQTYPDSVMKEDALELLMRTYQQTNNLPKTEDAATRLLQANPNNVTALALLSYSKRMQALSTQGAAAQQSLQQAADYGQKGITALQTYQKPEGMTDDQFAQLKTQLAGIFNASVGLNALQTKDYASAQSHLAVAAAANPTDFATTYQLALANLDAPQPNYLDGLWYIARAANLAPTPQYKQQISEYGRRKYIKYHGGDDGWTDILAQAASPTKPANFSIKPAPTPAEQAATLVQSTPVTQMSFDQIQMVLTSGNQDAATKVWNDLKDKPIKIEGKLISGSPTKLMIAGSYDDIQANKPDIELTMANPIPTRLVPKDGATVDFQGNPTTYDPNPFMIHMEKGVLLNLPTETPKRTSPTHRKPQ
jgi:hypothetical protein